MHAPATLVITAALALAGPWANGQTVYRCGNSYSQQPCEGGAALQVDDPRTRQEAARATRVAQSDRLRADEMEKARLAREKNAPRALIIGPQAPASAPQARKDGGKPKKAGKLETFTAVAPATGGGGKKKR